MVMNKYTLGLAAILAGGCASTQRPQPQGPRVEHAVLVDGHEVQRTSSQYAAPNDQNCQKNISLFTDPEDSTVQYSVLERTCDLNTNDGGIKDYRDFTRKGRGETVAYREETIVTTRTEFNAESNTLITRGDKCVVRDYNVQGSNRTLASEATVDCATLQAEPQPEN